MKKIFLFLVSALLMASSADAQFSKFLNGILGQSSSEKTEQSSDGNSEESTQGSGTIDSILEMAQAILGGVTTNQEFNLVGAWQYNGIAVVLTSQNTLTKLAGDAAVGTIETKVDEALLKVGIKPGVLSFSFNEDKSFSCTFGKTTVGGTWSYDASNSAVTMAFGKTMQLLSMTGIVKTTLAGDTEILFNADKLFDFLKNLLSNSNIADANATLSTISSLLDKYEGLYIGFKLKKQ